MWFDDGQHIEDWSADLLHSGSRNSSALFCDAVWNDKDMLDSKQVAAIAKDLQKCVAEARESNDATPYERVGHVLTWLKESRTREPALRWTHSALREWMQGLLIDFSLADAKKNPGALLEKPEQHYRDMLSSWDSQNTGLPFDAIWNIKGQPLSTKTSGAGGMLEFLPGSGRVSETTFNLRTKLLKEAAPVMSLMTHRYLGATRKCMPSWRDVTDYGVLHPLLTLNETSFDKFVWLDFLQHQGREWSTPARRATWNTWQEAAQTSYQSVLQEYTGCTPQAVVRLDKNDEGQNPLKALARSPFSLDWYHVFSNLARRFAYLNQAPEFEALARSKMETPLFEKFKQESRERVGQPLILALLELPKELSTKDVFNMPEWFHARLKEEMTEKARLELPQDLLDYSQVPPLY
jgi:hypothetical protein